MERKKSENRLKFERMIENGELDHRPDFIETILFNYALGDLIWEHEQKYPDINLRQVSFPFITNQQYYEKLKNANGRKVFVEAKYTSSQHPIYYLRYEDEDFLP